SGLALHYMLLHKASTCVVHTFHTIITKFYFVNIGMTWHNARQYCRDHYTDLATFRNMDDIDSVTRPSYTYAWIGLFDNPASWQGVMTNDSTSWRWSATEAPSSSRYMKWSIGNPSNSGAGETCVDMYQGQWNDYPCNNALYFVCFKSKLDPEPSIQ
uniref:C-type lectin domain-containing protein n=1 Tax=Periophthalmus magnuspinnatus TaxID=409849 RepID=A0A3B4AFX3_9GOBI